MFSKMFNRNGQEKGLKRRLSVSRNTLFTNRLSAHFICPFIHLSGFGCLAGMFSKTIKRRVFPLPANALLQRV
jgi:hypothetical protein